MGAIIAGLFVWANLAGINKPPSQFYVTPLAFGLASTSLALAIASYMTKTTEKTDQFRIASALAAYCLLAASTALLVIGTGGANSPFLALWLITAVFVGAFGNGAIAALFVIVNAYALWLLIQSDLTREMFIGIVLGGELPIIVSYILWHKSTGTENKKDRTYYDLANQLNQVSNKSDVVIGAISDGVLAINNEGVIELINPAAQHIVGWGHQDALGLDYKSVLQLLNRDDNELDKSSDPIFEVLSTNQPVRRDDLHLQTSSGKKLSIEVVVSPIGRIGSGAIIVFRDVTKEQEEERAQAEFISTASHEMRTPVASIEGYLGLALNPATATIDAKAHEFITKAHEAAEHLGRLFQDLLDVTKADDGRLSNNPKVINVVDFTSTIIEGLKQKADQKGLRIFFKPQLDGKDGESEGGLRTLNPVYYVDLDADHLREVLANLIENAIKYTPRGEVVIDVQGDDEHVIITISDSGIGIPAEDIPHLFQKFYRVDNTDTREIGGTGLGLYLCRRLVEAMNGRIWVTSEYKKGSTFSIELPRISHEEANRLIEAAIEEPKETPTIPEKPTIGAIRITNTGDGTTAQPAILSHTEAPVSTAPVLKPAPATNSDVPVIEGAIVDALLATAPQAPAIGSAKPAPAPAPAPAVQPSAAPTPVATPSTQPAAQIVVPKR